MNLAVLKNEEKQMNLIMFIFMDIIPVVAFVYVLLFNGGQTRDAFALSMIGCSLLIKLFEKVLGKYAKYLYIHPACHGRRDNRSRHTCCIRCDGGGLFSDFIYGSAVL